MEIGRQNRNPLGHWITMFVTRFLGFYFSGRFYHVPNFKSSIFFSAWCAGTVPALISTTEWPLATDASVSPGEQRRIGSFTRAGMIRTAPSQAVSRVCVLGYLIPSVSPIPNQPN